MRRSRDNDADIGNDPAIERAATLSFQKPDDGQASRRLRPRADPLIALRPTNRRAERYAGTMLWFIRNRLRGS
jgi:hypothetical protein